MCINPIRIKNVNKGLGRIGLNFMKDCDNEYMNVPCGRCPDCVQAKQAQLVQRIQSEAKYNHLFFCTLTYDNEHLPKLTIEVPRVCRATNDSCGPLFDEGTSPVDLVSITPVSDGIQDGEPSEEAYLAMNARLEAFESTSEDFPSGPVSGYLQVKDKKVVNVIPAGYDDDDLDVEYESVDFPYADIHHIQLLLKNLRDNNTTGRNIRYVAVSELGKANGRPHFHILFLVEKRPEDYYGNGTVKVANMRSLEKELYTMVFKYWAINVGTRKNPVYEPLFTYRKRYYGGRVYTNFDLHWVDPSLSTEGESNVAYYVSKYIMKGSERDVKRQRFLRLNLSETEYEAAWKTVRCRMTFSKGLGLDARFETVETHEEIRRPCYEYAELQLAETLALDDLPDPDWHPSAPAPVFRTRMRRVMVPNFELVQWIKDNLMRDVGKSAHPVYISPDGVHRPLSPFYQKFGYIFSSSQAIEYWMNWNPEKDVDRSALSKEDKDRIVHDHERRIKHANANSTFDTSPCLLNPHEDLVPNPIETLFSSDPAHDHVHRKCTCGVGSVVRKWL